MLSLVLSVEVDWVLGDLAVSSTSASAPLYRRWLAKRLDAHSHHHTGRQSRSVAGAYIRHLATGDLVRR